MNSPWSARIAAAGLDLGDPGTNAIAEGSKHPEETEQLLN